MIEPTLRAFAKPRWVDLSKDVPVSALEAALQAMCFIYPEDVKRTTVYRRKRFRRKRYRALEFTLFELINIAD